MPVNKVTVDEQRTRKEDDMKTLISVIPAFVLCVGLTLPAFAADGTVSGGPFAGEAVVHSVASHELKNWNTGWTCSRTPTGIPKDFGKPVGKEWLERGARN